MKRIGIYTISNCCSLEIYQNEDEEWFVKPTIENSSVEKVELVDRDGHIGLMWGELFVDFEEVVRDQNSEDYPELEKSYSPSNPWDAPGMSIHDFI